MDVIDEAIEIARKDLRWCYHDRGILTGARLVYWSWDSFFASLGSLSLGDYTIVRKNIELYLSYQSKAGSIPKRISNPFYFMRFFGLHISEESSKQQPIFQNSYYTAPSIAQNPICVIAVHAYIEATGDHEFVKEHLAQLHRIFVYLEKNKGSFGLLKEGAGGGWAESVLKRGAITFTNICYARSLFCMGELCHAIGEYGWADQYHQQYTEIKEIINIWLWSDRDGGYYSDWLHRHRHHHFCTDGNLLAILWDIADEEKAQNIQDKIKELALEDDIPIRLAYSPYNYWRIFFVSRIAGLKDYHVGFSWTWLGCVDALVNIKRGEKQRAHQLLQRIAQVIVRDGTVHETYKNGQAVGTPFYKSEHPWAWGAGLFIKACAEAGYEVKEASDKL